MEFNSWVNDLTANFSTSFPVNKISIKTRIRPLPQLALTTQKDLGRKAVTTMTTNLKVLRTRMPSRVLFFFIKSSAGLNPVRNNNKFDLTSRGRVKPLELTPLTFDCFLSPSHINIRRRRQHKKSTEKLTHPAGYVVDHEMVQLRVEGLLMSDNAFCAVAVGLAADTIALAVHDTQAADDEQQMQNWLRLHLCRLKLIFFLVLKKRSSRKVLFFPFLVFLSEDEWKLFPECRRLWCWLKFV